MSDPLGADAAPFPGPQAHIAFTPALPRRRASNRLQNFDPSPAQSCADTKDAQSLRVGGAGGQWTKETSRINWDLHAKSHIEFVPCAAESEASDENDDSSDSSPDSDNEEDGYRAGSRIMNVSKLLELTDSFCCKKCVQRLVKEAWDCRLTYLEGF